MTETPKRIKIRGYKAFDSKMSCRGFKFEIGQEYKKAMSPVLCEYGFHFCRNLRDCFLYYPLEEHMIICEVGALGDIVKDTNDSKCCTNHIRIIKQIPLDTILRTINHGQLNFGFNNKGYLNIGNNNFGHRNYGNNNFGEFNHGNNNHGDNNVGSNNSGHFNMGDRNTGNGNFGCSNSGMGNRGSYNAGYFCLGDGWGGNYMFNQEIAVSGDVLTRKIYDIHHDVIPKVSPTRFVTYGSEEDIPKYGCKEKPEGTEMTNGFLMRYPDFSTAWIIAIEKFGHDFLQKIRNLPNYDPEIFKQIIGINKVSK